MDEAGISRACDRVTLVYLGAKPLMRLWMVQGEITSGYICIVVCSGRCERSNTSGEIDGRHVVRTGRYESVLLHAGTFILSHDLSQDKEPVGAEINGWLPEC
jgi:hypothetical protein